MMPSAIPVFSILILALAAGACRSGPDTGPAGSTPGIAPAEGPDHPMVGRLAPEFIAQDPRTGVWLPAANLKDKPAALLFFRPGAPFAAEVTREMGRWRASRTFGPVVFLALGQASADRLKQFAAVNRLDAPILRDPGSIAQEYGVGELPTLVLLDANRVVRFRLDGFAGRDYRRRIDAAEAALKALPDSATALAGSLDLDYTRQPRAPLFAARDLEGRDVDLARMKGRPVVLLFFDQDCPHCDRDLPGLVPVLREYRRRGVAAVGVASRDGEGSLARFLARHGIDFPVVLDAGREIFTKYQSTRTPDTFFIDGDGFIRFREQGDRPDRAALTRLQLDLLTGGDAATLAAALPGGAYVGDGTCRSCHQREYQDWLLTPHSIAWDSLQKGEKWRDPECVGCHVTGRDRPGGFSDPEKTSHMLNVQCEVCHGPAGGHPEKAGVDLDAMRRTCVACHTGKFVLNFDLDEAIVLMAHQEAPDLTKMFRYSDPQRRRLEQINKRRLEKFRSGVAYVGAGACRDCHRAEHEQWSRTPHASAFTRLLRADRGADPTCNPCHTTGAGHKGGFGDERATASMSNVQCEVCHGPGADHVTASPDRMKETIYGITDQCSFCIIQGVCATCHDAKNDPDFDIEAALPLVTH